LRRTSRLISISALLLLVLIIVLFMFLDPLESLPSEAWAQQLQSMGLQGVLMFLGLGIVATSIGLPRQLLAFIGGYAYGVAAGLSLALAASLGGCALTVLVSSTLLRKPVKAKFPAAIASLDRLVEHDAFIKILVLRLQPFGTNLLSNICAGFTSISLPLFLSASLLGYVPQALVFALTGSGVRVGSNAQLQLSLVLFALSVLLGFYLYRRHVNRRKQQS